VGNGGKGKRLFVNMEQILVFTDLDGTLIDHDTYGFEEALTALGTLRQNAIPVILCSSKTRAEIEIYRKRMHLGGPFIVENGGAIFVPPDTLNGPLEGFKKKGAYHVMELGTPYPMLRRILKEIKDKEKLSMKGFAEMTIPEIGAHTGLPIEEARLASNREYSEPFLFNDVPAKLQVLCRITKEKGLRITRGGRFFHLTGRNDKGRAVRILKTLFAEAHPKKRLVTVALGDSTNDVPMLQQADIPVVIRKKTGEWESIEGIASVVYSQSPGPQGWAEAIGQILHPDRG
jgi:mannosyl-3-phosphoglycerate phosphatase